jgi:hypothetical protein
MSPKHKLNDLTKALNLFTAPAPKHALAVHGTIIAAFPLRVK